MLYSACSSERSPVVVSQAVEAKAFCLGKVFLRDIWPVLVVGYRTGEGDGSYLTAGTEVVLVIDPVEELYLILEAEKGGSTEVDLTVVIYFIYIYSARAGARERSLH